MRTPTPSGTAPSTSPWRLDAERRLLARALAEPVVTEVAPEELPLFERRARSYFRPRLWRRRPLSLDVVGLAADVVTPAALSAAVGVLGVMSAELVSRLTSRLVDRVARRRRRAEVEPAEPTAPAAPPVAAAPAPTAAELARWRAAALSGALRHVSAQRAERVADSVLAELVQMLATNPQPEPTADQSPPGTPPEDGDSAATGR
ncbi:hypothetical protein [Streptomyces griseus]|uniref:hypothetical protein n=1 Tax=Streptomyces griseus TaxID=1911 RepID=UPI00055B4098|nr:hypothetical protein [Streptomyces griseus]